MPLDADARSRLSYRLGVLVLLPPSESKAGRSRGKALDLPSLSHPDLTDHRRMVLDALAEVSGRPDAHEVLGVSPNLVEEVARNTRLTTAPAPPAAEVYTGVLYDALGLGDLTPGSDGGPTGGSSSSPRSSARSTPPTVSRPTACRWRSTSRVSARSPPTGAKRSTPS
ncbi:peroxide stress protein YaaA [Janibacter hoylei]|uniref:peroxide stress protein YaaA n=1 Tax=Janibacter hoylei TaxID=364298 RepID=UPI002AA2B2C4|nr:peroxide stress protein YaaA [Janibacter hoylei]